MAEQIIDFKAAERNWQGARQHLHTVESVLRMIKSFASTEFNGTEFACDVELVCNSALREVVLSDEHLDEIEKTLTACRKKIVGE